MLEAASIAGQAFLGRELVQGQGRSLHTLGRALRPINKHGRVTFFILLGKSPTSEYWIRSQKEGLAVRRVNSITILGLKSSVCCDARATVPRSTRVGLNTMKG